ncbi:hypothetical protein FQN57_005526 [Myotisia sp. PD_48]|nr:hypothetical protein FQN57_005526 [Myotisia sp. PD_48]
MKFSSIFIPAILATFVTASSNVHNHNRRDGNDVAAAIRTIASKVVQFKNAVQDLKPEASGTTPEPVKLQATQAQIVIAERKAVELAKTSEPFNDQEATKILDAQRDLVPKIKAMLDALAEKRRAFEGPASDISPEQMRETLKKQKEELTSLGTSIVSKLPEQRAAEGMAINQQLTERFDKTIRRFILIQTLPAEVLGWLAGKPPTGS